MLDSHDRTSHPEMAAHLVDEIQVQHGNMVRSLSNFVELLEVLHIHFVVALP